MSSLIPLPLAFGLYWFDPMYFLFLAPALLLAVIAQLWVKSAFAKYSRQKNTRQLTGAQAARKILDDAGLDDVEVRESSGFLSDHYDPRTRTVNLSPAVYRKPSIAAVGIAAHEVGHAIQHAKHYAPLALRQAMAPAVTLGQGVYMILLFGGMLLSLKPLILAGIVAFSVIVLFALVTLPVEFNASFRAMAAVTNSDILYPAEKSGVRAVLTAAALTYVAGALQAIMILLYYLWRLGIIGGRD